MVVSVDAGQVVALSGRVDVSTAFEVRQALQAAVDLGSGDLVLDVSQVDLVDATGLGVLVGIHRRASQAQRRVVLRGVDPHLRRILRLTRLHRVLVVESTSV